LHIEGTVLSDHKISHVLAPQLPVIKKDLSHKLDLIKKDCLQQMAVFAFPK